MSEFKKGEYYAIRHPHLNYSYGKVSSMRPVIFDDNSYISVIPGKKKTFIRFTLDGKYYVRDTTPALHPTSNKSILRYLYD
jgi:hypothetical protein